MGVIVQAMVQPQISGVSFSKNPLTGLDETVVEAVPGSGELLVQDGVTPQRWVSKLGQWTDRPTQESIPVDLIQSVVDQTKTISKTFKQPVDLEWVYDGDTLYWVQMREITSLNDQPVYSNTIAKELLPGIIKPLVWSVNTPIVNRAWVDLISEVIGDNGIDPSSLSKSFYYRAYFNMGTFGRIFEHLGMPPDSLERMRGQRSRDGTERPILKPSGRTFALLPRILSFAIDKWRFSQKIMNELPRLETAYKAAANDIAQADNTRQLVEATEQLKELTRQAAYFNIVGPLLMSLYNGILRRLMKQIGTDYESLDLMEDMKELKHYDPGHHLQVIYNQLEQLEPSLQEQIRHSRYAEFRSIPGIEDFQASVASFIERFGHLSDSGTDFSARPWREDPDMILGMIARYSPTGERTYKKIKFEQLPVKGFRRTWLSLFYTRARQYRLYREQISSVYTYGYGLFRNCYLALGDALVQQKRLEHKEDVFYLYEPELQAMLSYEQTDKDAASDYPSLVNQRKLEIEQVQEIELPEVIYGDHPPPVNYEASQVLYGTPTARGYYTGRVIHVHGIQDFTRVQDGDVVVVPYSDVGWTPLFTRAGAVIAEAGGILSHCSIVAREYGIPAVVSVSGTVHLKDDMTVTVDGYKGEIILHDEQEDA